MVPPVPGTEQLAGCVLWHAPEQEPSPELLGALERKRIGTVLASDQYAALALACRLRAAGGVVVLLLHEPAGLIEHHGAALVTQLLESLALFVPACTVWAYESAASPELRGFDPAELEPEVSVPVAAPDTPWSRPGSGARAARPPSTPELRLVNPPRDHRGTEPARASVRDGDPLPDNRGRANDSPELTEDELAALLGLDRPDDPHHEPGTGGPSRGLGSR